jgi:hypothetical protein
MRIWLGLALALTGAGSLTGVAQAQSGNAIAVPPPPPIMASPPSPPVSSAPAQPVPPGLVQTPVPPANSDTGTPAADNGSPPATSTGTPPAAAMPVSNDWVPGHTAEIGVLDRVDGGIANLNIPVGSQVTSGDLTISVLACVMRPANEIPDAAIFVNVQATGNAAAPPIFHGWMVRSIPAATVVGDSSETLRVANCT